MCKLELKSIIIKQMTKHLNKSHEIDSEVLLFSLVPENCLLSHTRLCKDIVTSVCYSTGCPTVAWNEIKSFRKTDRLASTPIQLHHAPLAHLGNSFFLEPSYGGYPGLKQLHWLVSISSPHSHRTETQCLP